MRILMLAPQPFYQPQGTHIALDQLLRILSKRQEQVDLVTYAEGINVDYDSVQIYRIPRIPFLLNIYPSFSWKKIVCDLLMFYLTIQLILKNRYQLIHAIEESVYIAIIIRFFLKIPYVYDMDSSLVQQLVNKYPCTKFITPLLNFFEGAAIKHAKVVVLVCDALATDIQKYRPKRIFVIPDASLINGFSPKVRQK